MKPIRLNPIFKKLVWGSETWVVSGHESGMSIVADGEYEGRSLADLCAEFGRALLGAKAPEADRFPLLIKVIDAKQKLSVQVHPSPCDPTANPHEYKNECWHILGCEGDAVIYAGFKDVAAAKRERDPAVMKDYLVEHHPSPSQTIFIPSGTVHAIGGGCLIFEVQQSSNTTYRFYDWGRIGTDGKPRQLHVEAALRSIDWSLPTPRLEAPRKAGDGAMECIKTPYFRICEYDGDCELDTKGESFHALFVRRGEFDVACNGETFHLAENGVLLIPACCGKYAAKTNGGSLLVSTL